MYLQTHGFEVLGLFPVGLSLLDFNDDWRLRSDPIHLYSARLELLRSDKPPLFQKLIMKGPLYWAKFCREALTIIAALNKKKGQGKEFK